MRKIILKQIAMEDFRGGTMVSSFKDDENVISGKNGSGKSRHFDAFIWCLFGKDTQDRKDYEIKTRLNGEEMHGVDSTVHIVINIDGKDIKLSRTLHEEWVKPRGQVDRVFKGNITLCGWNDTPISVGDFSKRIGEIIDPTLFKILTNPEYFLSLHWKEIREQLFNIAGGVSLQDIKAKYPEYQDIITKLGNSSFEEFKKNLNTQKKRLSEDLKNIQPKIEQVNSLLPDEVDTIEIQSKISTIDKKIDDILQLSNKANAEKTIVDNKKKIIKNEIDILENKIINIYRNEISKAQNEAVEKNTQRNNLLLELKKQESNKTGLERQISYLNSNVKSLEDELSTKKQLQDSLREKWYNINSKQFDGDTVCPYCGNQLPADKIENALSEFNLNKEKDLNRIQEEGQKRKAEIEEIEQRLKETKDEISHSTEDINRIKATIDRLNDELKKVPFIEPKKVIVEEIPDCIKLQKQIDAKWEEINSIAYTNCEVDSEYKNQLINERDKLIEQLSKNDIRKKMLNEIALLHDTAKVLAQKIADIEKQEFESNKLSKCIIDSNEEKINRFFDIVRFKLFDMTIDGNIVETCMPIVNGVNYFSANKADKLNAGLDIIKTLSKFYGIECPIFIDNRESINTIIALNNQIINLVVTNDNLKINNHE